MHISEDQLKNLHADGVDVGAVAPLTAFYFAEINGKFPPKLGVEQKLGIDSTPVLGL